MESRRKLLTAAAVFLVGVLGVVFWRFSGHEPVPEVPLPENNTYAAANLCVRCHETEYWVWKNHPHANAFAALQRAGNTNNPECLSCHVTAFNRPEGWVNEAESPHLKDVKCGACHGPGLGHTMRPDAGNIRGSIEPALCATCHTPTDVCLTESWTADFDSVVEEFYANPHRPASPRDYFDDFQRIAYEVFRERRPITLEVFVMAECGFGNRLLEGLVPWVKHMHSVDLKVRFIAFESGNEEKEAFFGAPPTQAELEQTGDEACFGDFEESLANFQSLHGASEVREGILLTVVQETHPQRFLDFLQCRLRQEDRTSESSVLDCMEVAGIDATQIEEVIASSGDFLFSENIRHAWERRVRVSPTVFIAGKKWWREMNTASLMANLCQVTGDRICADLRFKCGSDYDCRPIGEYARCVDTGEASLCEPVEGDNLRVAIVNDPHCPTCNTYNVVTQLFRDNADPDVQQFTPDSREGERLLALLPESERRVPAYFIREDDIDADSAFLDAAQPRLTAYGEWYHYDLGDDFDKPLFIDRTEKARTIDLFVEPLSVPSLQLHRLIANYATTEGRLRLLHYPVHPWESEDLSAAERELLLVLFHLERQGRPGRLQLFVNCIAERFLRSNQSDAIDWRPCAQVAGIPIAEVEQYINSEEARETYDQRYAAMEAIADGRIGTLINNRLLVRELNFSHIINVFSQMNRKFDLQEIRGG